MSKTVYKITDKPTATAYDDTSLKARITALENKPDNDKQTLTFTEGNRNLSISNGNTVTLPDYLKKDDAYSTFPTYAKLQDEISRTNTLILDLINLWKISFRMVKILM